MWSTVKLRHRDATMDPQLKSNNFTLFYRDNGELSKVYQERFVPRLKDRSHNFLRWLIDTDLICSSIICPNAKNDPKCNVEMEIVLALSLCDLYQLR